MDGALAVIRGAEVWVVSVVVSAGALAAEECTAAKEAPPEVAVFKEGGSATLVRQRRRNTENALYPNIVGLE